MSKFSALFFIFFFYGTAYACIVSDDARNRIERYQAAQRIISLAPDITETLFAIGAGQHVVGVIAGSDYPLAAQTIPLVGSYNGLDLEKIISLHPDLIVTWGHTFSRQLAVLKKLGIPVYITQPERLEDIPRTMRNLGCLAGTEKMATQAAQHFSHELAALQTRFHAEKPITVFYQIGGYSLITINKSSWINQVITLCGGKNIFAEASFTAPEVSWEAVVSANPQAIIDSDTNDHWKKNWMKWQAVFAVKHHALFTIHPDLIERAGPRLWMGAAQVCEKLKLARDISVASSKSPP